MSHSIPGSFERRPSLLYARATPLNQDNQHDDKKQSGYNPDNRGLIHFDSLPSFEWLRTYCPKNVLNESAITSTAGPSTTKKSEGKIKSTSGNSSLTDSLAAFSSIS